MRFASLLVFVLVAVGCGDDVAPPNDAAVLPDNAIPDIAIPDAPADGDGGEDASDDASGPVGCTVDLLGVVGTDSQPVAYPIQASASAEGALITWQERREGKQDIYMRSVPNAGPIGPEVQVTDTFATSGSPSVLAKSGLIAWSDNVSGNFEIYTAQTTGLSPNRISDNTFRDVSPILVDADSPLIFWFEASRVKGGVLAANGTLSTACIAADGAVPEFFTAGTFMDGAILSWIDPATSTVVVQRATAAGCALGNRVTVSDANSTAGISDVAHIPQRGGVVAYDLGRRIVETQAINLEGEKVGLPQPLTEGTAQGYGPSIAAFAGGYVVSYWATDRDLDMPEVRLRFLDSNGKRSGDPVFVASGEGPSRTKVVVSNDGTIFVFYSVDQPEVRIEVGRATCVL